MMGAAAAGEFERGWDRNANACGGDPGAEQDAQRGHDVHLLDLLRQDRFSRL
jgi:hypothetical protein